MMVLRASESGGAEAWAPSRSGIAKFRRRPKLKGSRFASMGRTDCVAERRLFLPEFTSLSTGIHHPKWL